MKFIVDVSGCSYENRREMDADSAEAAASTYARIWECDGEVVRVFYPNGDVETFSTHSAVTVEHFVRHLDGPCASKLEGQ